MSFQSWQQTLITAQAAGTTLSNSTTATSILVGQAKVTLAPSIIANVGAVIRVNLVGQISNLVTTPGTLTLDLRLGGTVVFTSGAMQLSTTAHTTLPLWWEVLLTAHGAGPAATFMGQGRCMSQAINISTADSTSGHSMLLTPNITPATGGAIDLTSALQLDCFATFSIASASNAFTSQQFTVESLN